MNPGYHFRFWAHPDQRTAMVVVVYCIATYWNDVRLGFLMVSEKFGSSSSSSSSDDRCSPTLAAAERCDQL